MLRLEPVQASAMPISPPIIDIPRCYNAAVDLVERNLLAGRANKLAYIDLNGMSQAFYTALGPERSQAAHPVNNGKLDNTHHNNYGAAQLARLVAQGLRDALLRHKDLFLLSYTEHLMTYALGRRLEAQDMWAVRRVIRDADKKSLIQIAVDLADDERRAAVRERFSRLTPREFEVCLLVAQGLANKEVAWSPRLCVTCVAWIVRNIKGGVAPFQLGPD